jgi:hypothetical protein
MRLIDADALLARMKKAMESGSNLNGTLHLHIEHAPTITRPTGEWIMWENQRDEDVANGNYLYSCSNCGHADVHAKTQSVPYCWYCGARMNKGGDSE